jgi:uncharacterized protein (DUF952 family)
MIYHMLPESEWSAVEGSDAYAPASLRNEGFIHFSESKEQLLRVANSLYRGGDQPWVILLVDETTLDAPLRWEGDQSEKFPHLYGPLGLHSVVSVSPFPRREDGVFDAPVW